MPTSVSVLHLILIILTKQLQWCHWWCQWDHMNKEVDVASPFHHLAQTNGMVPLMTLLPQWDSETNINGIRWPKSYVAQCSSNLDLINRVVLLTMPLVAHDADASADCVSWLKKSCRVLSQSSWSNKCNGTFTVIWCQHWYHVTKDSSSTLFQSSWPSKQNIAIDNAISILSCSHWCKENHRTETVMWHLVSVVFTK